jgi:hypothetical protein
VVEHQDCTQIAFVTTNAYSDLSVVKVPYYYGAVDTSFNRSGNSAEVIAKAELRTVTLVFNDCPASTDGTCLRSYRRIPVLLDGGY